MSQPVEREYEPLPVLAVLFIWIGVPGGAAVLMWWGLAGFPLEYSWALLSISGLWGGALMFWLAKGSTSWRDGWEDLPNARSRALLIPIYGLAVLYFVLRYLGS